MMTPEQVQRTMDFILQSQANALIRMDRFHEELRQQKGVVEDLVEISRNGVERNARMDEVMRMIAEILAMQSSRLTRLEDQSQ